jgi:2'-5' RNA ligase
MAIELSDDAKLALRAVLGKLEGMTGFGAGRWVSAERMHLTLRFLGDTEDPSVSGVTAAMDRVAATFSPLSLTLAGTGFFPTAHKPRIAWVGVNGQVDALAQLESALSAELMGLGIAREPRPFHPHLTLVRMRHSSGSAERRALVDLVRSLQIDVPIVARDLCLLGAPADVAPRPGPASPPAYALVHRSTLTAESSSPC